MECGRPETGIVRDVCLIVKRNYKKACKEHKARQKETEWMDLTAERDPNTFWKRVKYIRGGNANSTVPENMDGLTSPDDIAELFAHKFGQSIMCTFR